MAAAWPSALCPQSVGFWPEFLSRGGGAATNGSEQTVTNPNMRWRAAVVIPINTRARVLAARQLVNAGARGAASAVAVPAFDKRQAPWPADFSPISMQLASDAALRATELSIDIINGGALEVGQRFSIAGNLYEIVAVVFPGTVTIISGLRAAAAATTVVDFNDPVCPMKLINDDQVRTELDSLRFAHLTLEFREDY